MINYFIFKQPQQRLDRAHGAFGEGTEGAPPDIAHLVFEHRQVVLCCVTELDPVEQPGDRCQTVAAGRAPATALAGEELVEVARYRHHAGVFVEHRDPRRAEPALDLFERVEVHHQVKVLGGQVRCRRTARQAGLEFFATKHTTTDLFHHFTQGYAER